MFRKEKKYIKDYIKKTIKEDYAIVVPKIDYNYNLKEKISIINPNSSKDLLNNINPKTEFYVKNKNAIYKFKICFSEFKENHIIVNFSMDPMQKYLYNVFLPDNFVYKTLVIPYTKSLTLNNIAAIFISQKEKILQDNKNKNKKKKLIKRYKEINSKILYSLQYMSTEDISVLLENLLKQKFFIEQKIKKTT